MIEEILASDDQRICVIAAPGSGKTTRILIPKAAQILENTSINPDRVLLLTFSRLSAKDLKEKVSLMGDRAPKTTTVHALCLSFLLSENDHNMRVRVESILLDFEKETLLWDLKLIFQDVRKPDLKNILEAFSAGWATNPHDEVFEESEFERDFKIAVIQWLDEYEAVMMEEIVQGAVVLARQLGTSDFIQRPQYILVDEYQDLNDCDQGLMEIRSARGSEVFVVGDDDQSIYGFRFANPIGIREFTRRFDPSVQFIVT